MPDRDVVGGLPQCPRVPPVVAQTRSSPRVRQRLGGRRPRFAQHGSGRTRSIPTVGGWDQTAAAEAAASSEPDPADVSHSSRGELEGGSWTPAGSLWTKTNWVAFLARNGYVCRWPNVCDGYANDPPRRRRKQRRSVGRSHWTGLTGLVASVNLRFRALRGGYRKQTTRREPPATR